MGGDDKEDVEIRGGVEMERRGVRLEMERTGGNGMGGGGGGGGEERGQHSTDVQQLLYSLSH